MSSSVGFQSLEWDRLNYSVRSVDPSDPKKWVDKQILFDVSGRIRQGRLLAVMGVSGSGKTSMLNILAGRMRSSSFSGNVALDGLSLNKEQSNKMSQYLNLAAFIQQKDLFYATNTVEEHLRFYQRMLGVSDAKVEQVISLLNLSRCRSALIGSEEQLIGKGISGGEMKRLSVAAELLREPKLIFADEPTSGLDSSLAIDVVEILKKLSRDKECLTACTIHQPSSEIYNKFDDLCLMAEGRIVYFGDREEAVEYFKSEGFECPNFVNPADYWISICSSREGDAESQARVKKLISSWENGRGKKFLNLSSESNEEQQKIAAAKLESKSVQAREAHLGFWSQTKALFSRLTVTVRRDPMLTKARIGQTLFLGLIVGLIYLRAENNQEGVQNRTGSAFFVIVNQAMSNIIGLLQTFPLEKPIILREARSGLYGPAPYFLARTMLGVSLEIFYPAVFGAITFFMIGFDVGQPSDGKFSLFLWYELILILVSIAGASLGYLLSALAPSTQAAMAMGPAAIMPLMIFGGLFVNSDSVPVYFLPFEAISFIKYGFHALCTKIFENIETIACENTTKPGMCLFKTGEDVLNFYAFKKENLELNLGLCVLLAVIFRGLAFLALKKSFDKTK